MTLPRHIYLSNIANFPSVSRPNGYWVNWSVFVWCKVLRNLFLFEAYENHKWRGTLNLDKVRTVPWILNKHGFALLLKVSLIYTFHLTPRVCSSLKLILKDSISDKHLSSASLTNQTSWRLNTLLLLRRARFFPYVFSSAAVRKCVWDELRNVAFSAKGYSRWC